MVTTLGVAWSLASATGRCYLQRGGVVKTHRWGCDRTGSRTSDVPAERLGTEPLI